MQEPRIVFQTNLDRPKRFVSQLNEEWTGPVPSVGHRFVFGFTRLSPGEHESMARKSFDLVVVEVSWSMESWDLWDRPDPRQRGAKRPVARVDLHIPTPFRSIAEWEAYYRRHVEGRPE